MNNETNVKVTTADPSAIGLFGLAMVTLVASTQKLGTTAFGGYAFFWLGVACSWLMKLGLFGENIASQIDPKQLGVAFLGYLIFTLYMTIGAMETNKNLFIIFVLIDFLFIGLTLTSFEIATEATHKLAAYSEMLIAIFSFYGSAAAVLNNQFGRVFLPIGKPFGIFKKPVK